MRSYDHEIPLSSRLIKKGDAFPIAGSIACSKKDLHPPFVRESFLILMRTEIARALGLIVVGLMTSLAACQSGGTASSRAEITDPNTAFSQGGAKLEQRWGRLRSKPSMKFRHLE
jgi:hypothetical protein